MDIVAQGTLIDDAISAYHLGFSDCVTTLRKQMSRLMRRHFGAYVSDVRNINVYRDSIQLPVFFRFQGSEYRGKIDQCRSSGIWEIKYSSLSATEIVNYYLSQLLCYSYALQAPVGGIVNVAKYGTGEPVFHRIHASIPTSREMTVLHGLIQEAV